MVDLSIGQFGPATGSPLAVGFNPLAVAIGDFTGDGALDLAAANAGGNNVAVLLNTTASTTTARFAQAAGSPITVGTFPGAVALGDFNNDGPLDLAVTNGLSFNVSAGPSRTFRWERSHRADPHGGQGGHANRLA